MYKVLERNKIELEKDIYPGDIILLWRINFNTYTTETVNPRYFVEVYGIEPIKSLEKLVKNNFVIIESAFDSLDHVRIDILKNILKEKGIKNVTKMKKVDVDNVLREILTEEELSSYFNVRGYKLTKKGEKLLKKYQEVVDKHPKKK